MGLCKPGRALHRSLAHQPHQSYLARFHIETDSHLGRNVNEPSWVEQCTTCTAAPDGPTPGNQDGYQWLVLDPVTVSLLDSSSGGWGEVFCHSGKILRVLGWWSRGASFRTSHNWSSALPIPKVKKGRSSALELGDLGSVHNSVTPVASLEIFRHLQVSFFSSNMWV